MSVAVVFKSPYVKGGKAAGKAGYIARRIGVDKSINNKVVINANYIATRPQVEKFGTHGLFSNKTDLNLNEVLEELRELKCNVWLPMLSLTREDAKNAVKDRPWYTSEEGTGNSQIPIVIKEGVQPLYRAAAKACMSRNRDNNGNEKIDEDEIRWYLAAVEQYRALFFGQAVLEQDVRLFGSQEDVTYFNSLGRGYHFETRGAYHYWTSSGTSAGTFWPEEGMTDNIAGNPGWGVCRAEMVRCVRTLGNL